MNAQNLPRDDRVRCCFVPRPGHVFLDADYAAIEMVTLAQGATAQFGLRSRLAEALNAGQDPHRMVAALATGKPEAEVTGDERQKAKPINFGKPGGMGDVSLQDYARASYGVDLTDAEVEQLSEAWFRLFPEMREFLREPLDLGEEVARFFDLTPATYFEHTGSRKFLDHPDNAGGGRRPHPVLGGMALKVLKQPDPETRAGRPYAAAELDYFWTQVEARLGDAARQPPPRPSATGGPPCRCSGPSWGWSAAPGVFTLTGRLRATRTYSARHNNIFQGLAADGAKLALWKVVAGRATGSSTSSTTSSSIEVPAGSDLRWHAAEIRRLMIEGMAEVVPDVRVEVECVAPPPGARTPRTWSMSRDDVASRPARRQHISLSHPSPHFRKGGRSRPGRSESRFVCPENEHQHRRWARCPLASVARTSRRPEINPRCHDPT